jgi:predicted outer membrane repeat protein
MKSANRGIPVRKVMCWLIGLLIMTVAFAPAVKAQSMTDIHATFIPGTNQPVIAGRHDLQIYANNTLQLQETIPVIPSVNINDYISHVRWSHTGQYFTVAYSSDDSSMPQKLQIRNANTGAVIAEFEGLYFQSGVELIDWSPDDQYLAVGDVPRDEILIIRAYDGMVVNQFVLTQDDGLLGLNWHPVTQQFAAIIAREGGERLWLCHATMPQSQCTETGPYEISSDLGIHFNADGTLIAWVSWDTTADHLIEIRDTSTFQLVRTLTGHTEAVWQLAWETPKLASVAYDSTLRIWNGDTGTLLITTAIPGLPSSLIWGPDGTTLLYVHEDKPIELRSDSGTILAQMCDTCVQRFTLINADTDAPIRTLSNNDTINLASLTTRNLNIRAEFAGKVGHIDFTLTSSSPSSDADFPFAVFGDTNGNFNAWTPAPGSYTLTATPYNRRDVAGTPLSITFTVTDTACTTTVGAGDVSGLVSAITTANTNAGADTICLTNSAYTLTASNNSNLGNNGLPRITSDITILGNGATITRSGSTEFRHFKVESNGNLKLYNLTLTNGDADSTWYGGSIHVNSGQLTLGAGVTLTGNLAQAGGAVHNNLGTVTIQGATLTGNMATGDGGAVYGNGTFVISGSTLTNNEAGFENPSSSGSGGAIHVFNSTANLTLTDSQITGNYAKIRAGGVSISGLPQATITASTLADNVAGDYGGGVYISGSTVTISESDVHLNTTLTSGGGLFESANSTVTVTSTSFVGNEAKFKGGGLYNTSGVLVLDNVTIDDNYLVDLTSSSDGGGIYNFASSGASRLTVTDSLITTNSAEDQGGGVYHGAGSTSSIHNTCIMGNVSPHQSGVTAAVALDASLNWWGAANGPSEAGPGSGDGVNSSVNYSNFLTSACPGDSGAPAGGGTMLPGMAPAGESLAAERLATLESEVQPASLVLPFGDDFESTVLWNPDTLWQQDIESYSGYGWMGYMLLRDEIQSLRLVEPVDLTTAVQPELRFWRKADLSSADILAVEVSIDGATWTMVYSETNSHADWSEQVVDLTQFSGGMLYLRFTLLTAGTVPAGEVSTGYRLDNLSITDAG